MKGAHIARCALVEIAGNVTSCAGDRQYPVRVSASDQIVVHTAIVVWTRNAPGWRMHHSCLAGRRALFAMIVSSPQGRQAPVCIPWYPHWNKTKTNQKKGSRLPTRVDELAQYVCIETIDVFSHAGCK